MSEAELWYSSLKGNERKKKRTREKWRDKKTPKQSLSFFLEWERKKIYSICECCINKMVYEVLKVYAITKLLFTWCQLHMAITIAFAMKKNIKFSNSRSGIAMVYTSIMWSHRETSIMPCTDDIAGQYTTFQRRPAWGWYMGHTPGELKKKKGEIND